MSLLFNTVSRFVIASLPRSICLLILWLQSLSSVILDPKKVKPVTAFSPCICYEAMGPDAMILVLVGLPPNLSCVSSVWAGRCTSRQLPCRVCRRGHSRFRTLGCNPYPHITKGRKTLTSAWHSFMCLFLFTSVYPTGSCSTHS